METNTKETQNDWTGKRTALDSSKVPSQKEVGETLILKGFMFNKDISRSH